MVLGYEMAISSLDLKANGLKALPKGISEGWELDEDGTIDREEYYFKYGDWWEEDLIELAKAGVTGTIELFGEMGEWERYVLTEGMVEIYQGCVLFEQKPYKVLKDPESDHPQIRERRS